MVRCCVLLLLIFTEFELNDRWQFLLQTESSFFSSAISLNFDKKIGKFFLTSFALFHE